MRRPKAFVELSEHELRHEAEGLVRGRKMVSLETLCEAILETRKEYANRIRREKREHRAKISIN
jgi:hypothetical protein